VAHTSGSDLPLQSRVVVVAVVSLSVVAVTVVSVRVEVTVDAVMVLVSVFVLVLVHTLHMTGHKPRTIVPASLFRVQRSLRPKHASASATPLHKVGPTGRVVALLSSSQTPQVIGHTIATLGKAEFSHKSDISLQSTGSGSPLHVEVELAMPTLPSVPL
jgi:hypothetical protein